MKYKITIVHKLLVVYLTIRSLYFGCIYKRVDVMAVRVWCLLSCCGTVPQQLSKVETCSSKSNIIICI